MPDVSQDAVLMRRVRGGDRESFAELVGLHANGMLTFLRRTVGDFHRSEELFQETFFAVWKWRHTYQYPAPVRPWIYKIALNTSRAYWRKARLPMESIEGVDKVAILSDAGPADCATNREMEAIASNAVLELPLKQRTVVALRIWNGMTYREIADVMELTEATVRSHMHHALRTLRQQLAPKLSND